MQFGPEIYTISCIFGLNRRIDFTSRFAIQNRQFSPTLKIQTFTETSTCYLCNDTHDLFLFYCFEATALVQTVKCLAVNSVVLSFACHTQKSVECLSHPCQVNHLV